MGSVLLVTLLGFTAGCSSDQKPEPEVASSASEPRYAMDYATAVEGLMTSFSENEAEAQEIRGKFADYPGQLEKAPWEDVAEVIESAHATGKSQHYVDSIKEVGGARSFFDEEKSEITKKVGGATQYTVKQASCDVDTYGAVATSLDKSVKERLIEHQRRNNASFVLIERHEEKLGKENTDKLSEQADEVAFGSYIVHIEMVEQKVRLTQMLEEASDVKSTMDSFIEDEKAYQAESGRSDKEKEASEKRIATMTEGKSKIESVEKSAAALSEKIEERLDKAQSAYDDAVDDLAERYRKKGG